MYGRILVPVDGSETSRRGLAEAIEIAKSLGSRIRLVHIVNELIFDFAGASGVYADTVIQSLREGGQTILKQAESAVRQQGIAPECVLLESIGNRAADLILAQASEWPADLIVMGTHGRRGVRRAALGSDAEDVVRASSVPVLLVHAASRRGAGGA